MYCLRHFQIAREMFCIVCVTFVKPQTYLDIVSRSLLYSKRGVLYCLRHFYKAERCFVIVCVTFIKRATCYELFKTLVNVTSRNIALI